MNYKGFDKELRCRGYQYEIGKEYELDGPIKACNNGFHACERPLDVFAHYPPATSRYCVVEQSGELSKSGGDSKVASSKIKIGTEIGIPGLLKAQIEYVKAHTTTEHTDFKAATAGEYGAATAGDCGVATAGECGAATAGDCGAATAGDCGVATAGECGAATAGKYGAATAGDCGVATAGECGAATAGKYGAATAGDYGAATSRGSVSVGENGCGLVRGRNVKIRGGIGAILTICVEEEDSYDIVDCRTLIVDDISVKADTWYTLENGEIIEAE